MDDVEHMRLPVAKGEGNRRDMNILIMLMNSSAAGSRDEQDSYNCILRKVSFPMSIC